MRIAYVLEDGEDAHAWLDEIIAMCFARHGGRQSLIVPSLNGSISARYCSWLRAIDPDVVVLVGAEQEFDLVRSFVSEGNARAAAATCWRSAFKEPASFAISASCSCNLSAEPLLPRAEAMRPACSRTRW